MDNNIQNLIRLAKIDAKGLSTGIVTIKSEPISLERLYIVSEFDFKRRTVSSSLDALFSRNAETYMLDNRDRIQEIN